MSNLRQDVTSILKSSEQVQLYVKQKIYHPKINLDGMIITNQRIILSHPKDLRLRQDYTDYSYNDIANVILDKGILRSTIRCTLNLRGGPLILGNIPNSDATTMYRIIRSNITNYQIPVPYPAPNYVTSTTFPHSPATLTPNMLANQPGSSSQSCPKCAAIISTINARFCPACGTALTPEPSKQENPAASSG